MANFAINIGAAINEAPNSIGSALGVILNYGETHVFTMANFTTETIPPYGDPEGDAASKVKIIGNLPVIGEIAYNGTPILLNDEFTLAQLNTGLLVYSGAAGTLTEYLDSFYFDVADVGSGLYSGLPNGFYSIRTLAKVNEPPTVVGDGDETIAYGESLIFTRAMFTTSTTPPYSDPEGDPALNLKIITLPTDGTIKLNGVNVVLNQIVTFADIDSGLLIFVPSLVDTDGDVENFTFEIADAGSGQFVS